jgi:HD-GYP domain-containing protein (c-di-GMP phosphodiesterase class II)
MLAARLSALALVIAVAVAALTYLYLGRAFERGVSDLAQQEPALLLGRAAQIGAQRGVGGVGAVRIALDERLQMRLPRAQGRFVHLRLSALAPAPTVEMSESDYPFLREVKEALPDKPGAVAAAPQSASLYLGGRPHVRIVAPIAGRDGRAAGQVELVYAASDMIVQQARRTLINTTGIAVAIVAATTLLIYPVIRRLLTRLADLSEQLLDANLSTLSLLGAAIAKRDSDTDAHNYRVTLYSLHLGEAVGLADADMQALLKGAFLHDVGKIGIRDAVLLKPARLTAEEFDVMCTHVDHGLEMVQRSPWLADAAQVVGSHHEKVDGSGYPSGKRWEEIPIAARIFAIVDVFDALTSRRPYKEPLSFDEAVELLRQGRDTHFDGALLDRFLEIAPDLYQRYGGREDQEIKDELGELARRQFRAETLVS